MLEPGTRSAIFPQMPDGDTADLVSPDAAEQALAYLAEMSPDLRGGVIFDSDGVVLAAAGDRERWREDASHLLEVADQAGSSPVEQLHIATEKGEVFAVRAAGLVAVAVTERFALASLMLFDLRAVLRELGAGVGAEPG
jgi:predicted regulator of Ras-like GTPase activity (Roadblock/LC7/MglB family)